MLAEKAGWAIPNASAQPSVALHLSGFYNGNEKIFANFIMQNQC